MELGKRIVELRKQKGLTQEDIAELFQVTRQTISNWENGKSYPDITLLLTISEKFEVSLDELLKDDQKLAETLKRDAKTKKIFKLISLTLVIVILIIISFVIFKPKQELVQQVVAIKNSIEATKSEKCNNENELYYEENNQKIYLHCIDKIEIIEDEKRESLKDYLISNEKTIDWFISLFNVKSTYTNTNTKLYGGLKNGGWYSRSFKISKDEINIIRCNTIDGNNDVYIGDTNMKYDETFCK